jgi:hypothetical protein
MVFFLALMGSGVRGRVQEVEVVEEERVIMMVSRSIPPTDFGGSGENKPAF